MQSALMPARALYKAVGPKVAADLDGQLDFARVAHGNGLVGAIMAMVLALQSALSMPDVLSVLTCKYGVACSTLLRRGN